MQLPLSQGNLAAESSPAFSGGSKLSEVEQAVLWTLLQADPECPTGCSSLRLCKGRPRLR